MNTVLTILLAITILVIVFFVGMATGYRATVDVYEDKIDNAIDCGCFTRDAEVYGITHLETKNKRRF